MKLTENTKVLIGLFIIFGFYLLCNKIITTTSHKTNKSNGSFLINKKSPVNALPARGQVYQNLCEPTIGGVYRKRIQLHDDCQRRN